MDGRDFDSVRAQGFNDRIHFLPDQYEVARDRNLTRARRLEVDGIRRSHRFGDLHTAILDRLRAGNTKLIDATVHLALVAQGLVDRRGVEIDRRGRRRGISRSGSKRRLALRERCVQRSGELHRVAMTEDV